MNLQAMIEKQAGLANQHADVTRNAEELRARVKSLENEVKASRAKILQLERERLLLSEEHNALNPQISALEKQIALEKENREVERLVAESDSFEKVLTFAIESAQSVYAGVVSLVDPVLAARKVLQAIETMPPSRELVELKRGLREYEKGLEAICRARVSGHAPTPQSVLELHSRVKAFASSELVMSFWYEQ